MKMSIAQHLKCKLILLTIPSLMLLSGAGSSLAGGNGEQTVPQAAKPTDWARLLPEGSGKDYTAALCGGCHTVGILALQKRSRPSWRDFLEGMNLARATGGEVCACIGGPIDKDEIDIISSYLSEAFGPKNPIDQLPLNMNTASLGAILRLPGLTKADAETLLNYRKRSAFKNKREIEKVLGSEKFRQIEEFNDIKDSNFRSDGFLPM